MLRRTALLILLCLSLALPALASAADRKGSGTLRFRDDQALSDQVSLRLNKVPPPDSGKRYQGWLIADDAGTWTSIGLLAPAADGSMDLDWTSPISENLLMRYSRFAVTQEPAADNSAAPAPEVVYYGQITPSTLGIVRELLVQGSDTPLPGRPGIAVGLRDQVLAMRSATRSAQNAALEGRVISMSRSDEQTLNIIEGVNSGLYRDWNVNGVIDNTGDSYGLLRYATSAQQLMRQAGASANATKDTLRFANEAISSTDNVVSWATQLRSLALVVSPTAELSTTQRIHNDMAYLANLALRGNDTNGNGEIDAELAEGGANTVYNSAQGLARIEIDAAQPGAVPVPPTTAASTAPAAPAASASAEPAPIPISLPDTGARQQPIALLLGAALLLLLSGWMSQRIARVR